MFRAFVFLVLSFVFPWEGISAGKWAQTLREARSSEQLRSIQAKCLRMAGRPENTQKTQRKWERRLQTVQECLKTTRGQSKTFFEEPTSYLLKKVLINTRNPTVLDLHGVASIGEAKKKVLDFIRVAKSARKKSIIVITGKGNHANRGGQYGTLFKLLPGWVEDCESVKRVEARSNAGNYKLFLEPSLKLQKVNRYRPLKHEEERNFIYEATSPEKPAEGDLRAQQLKREFIRLKHRKMRQDYQQYIKVCLQGRKAYSPLSSKAISFYEEESTPELIPKEDVFLDEETSSHTFGTPNEARKYILQQFN